MFNKLGLDIDEAKMSTLVAICDTDGDGKISEEVNPFLPDLDAH